MQARLALPSADQPTRGPAMPEWWKEYFGPDYLVWYAHQTPEEARAQARFVHGLLGEAPGAVLDVCCGYGRHSLPLSELGRRVVGLDYSQFLLDEAARRSQGSPNAPRWVRGDMRRLPFAASFGAVVNLYTSFGFFDDPRDDQAALAEMARVLVPGGRIVIDVANRDRSLSDLHCDWRETEEGFFLQRTTIDWVHDRAKSENVWIKEGEIKRCGFEVRLYSLAKLAELVERVGLKLWMVYGGLDGATYHPAGKRVVVVAEKG